MLRKNTVFLAHCYKHPCRVASDDGLISGLASLVSISPERARVHLTNGMRGSLRTGQAVVLSPLFVDAPGMSARARIRHEEEDCLHLCFDPALPLTGFELFRLARKQ